MTYYIILCYIAQGNRYAYGILYRPMSHLQGYWWTIRCTTMFFVTSPRILVVYKVYYYVLCCILEDIGCIDVVLHRPMLHPPGYWWYIWCTTSFYFTSPRVLVVTPVYYIVLCYIPQGTGSIYGVLYRPILHPLGYWWCIWRTTSFLLHRRGFWWCL